MSRRDFAGFRARVERAIATHPVVVKNAYTAWFSTGQASREEIRRFTIQFSVFSHSFIEAQLRKCINAPDLSNYRLGKEILMNELGVTFCKSGSVDGGRFRFRAAHFEWLLHFAAALGIEFRHMGKRCHASVSTLRFCDDLMRLYGSDDTSTAQGASYAIEHWAAAGFWKELIGGLRAFQKRECPLLPLGFWTWHDRIEDQHASHTDDELRQAFLAANFDEGRFMTGASQLLDAVKAFWDGLQAQRLTEKAAA